MTITMNEQKIQDAAAYLYEQVRFESPITLEQCVHMARQLQDFWQDTELAPMLASEAEWILDG